MGLFKKLLPKSDLCQPEIPMDIIGGNPGYLEFVIRAYDLDPAAAAAGFDRMREANILGDKLYMLWNDCCGRDTQTAVNVMLREKIAEILRHINYEGGRGIPFLPCDNQKPNNETQEENV